MRFLLTVLISLGAVMSAQAQSYPTKPVRIIVGWAPGGIADVAARIVGQKLSEKWGQQALVENRPGASGAIADAVAARADADGYSVLLAASPEVTTNPHMNKSAPRYFDEALEPVLLVSVNPMVLVGTATGPYKSVKELVEAAKAKPSQIAYSSSGAGSAPHLAAEVFSATTGVKLKHVPYKGGGPAAVAVAGGETPVGFITTPAAVPYVKSGKMNVLGLSTAQRVEFLPDWPTLSEAGVPNFNYTVWTGLFVQKGTPAEIVRKLDADFRAVLADPAVIKQFEAVGSVVGNESLAAFKERIKRDSEANKAVVEREGLKAE